MLKSVCCYFCRKVYAMLSVTSEAYLISNINDTLCSTEKLTETKFKQCKGAESLVLEYFLREKNLPFLLTSPI